MKDLKLRRVLLRVLGKNLKNIYPKLSSKDMSKSRKNPNLRISGKAKTLMTSWVSNMFKAIATGASRLSRDNKNSTITTKEIQTALVNLLPKELLWHAVSEGNEAVTKYASQI